MADEQTGGQAPAANNQTDPQAAPAPAQGSIAAFGPEAERIIRELRQEAAGHRKRAAEAEAELNGLKAGQMSDAEKAAKALADATAAREAAVAELRATRLQLAVEAAGRTLNLHEPTIAGRLIDAASVQWDGDKPTNVDALLADIVKGREWLTTQTQQQAPAGGQAPAPAVGAPGSQPRRLTRADVQRMTSDQINANWEAVQAALSGP